MKHFYCKGGCNGLSDQEGVCQATECADHGQTLHECNCEDNKHGMESSENAAK